MDSGDTAWMLTSTALVLFMTPGLALFYGGMVRSKHVLGMLMQNFAAMGLIAVLWALVGFTLAFGDFGNGGILGNLEFLGLSGVGAEPGLELTIPFVLFAAYQMTFAVITPALITGATADRMKFSAYLVFI
ncbi:MAG: ammonia channel protein, partial [Actinomycetota bacterium]|nr:ammonia channel protein [Actinomycetota bacterium]